MLWGEIEESEKAGSHKESNPGCPLAWAASALPLSHNSWTATMPSQSSICTAQMVLNASVAHLAAAQYVSGCHYFRLIAFISSVRQDALSTTANVVACLQHHHRFLCTPVHAYIKNTHWQELNSYIKNYSTDVGYAPWRCLIAFSYTEKERATLAALWKDIKEKMWQHQHKRSGQSQKYIMLALSYM